MILKLNVSPAHADSSWLWLDGITKCQSYGLLPNPTAENPESLMFYDLTELDRAVANMWGDADARSWFADQIWPEFGALPNGDLVGRYVACFRVERGDSTAVLVLAAGPAFLMSDAGSTIERLHG